MRLFAAVLVATVVSVLDVPSKTGLPRRDATLRVAGYYATVDDEDLTGCALRRGLHELIDDHTFLPYSSSATDVQDILREADEAPGTTLSMLTWYKNSIEPKDASPITWDREHLWPVSYGFPQRGVCNYPDTDAHAIVAEDPTYNNARGNAPFGWCDVPGQCGAYDVVDHPDTPNRRGRGVWQVWPDRRGDVARALFYLDVRYDGSPHKESGCPEPDLVLTDSLELIQTSGGVNAAVAHMGLRSVLLAWHHGDPVDWRELTRNAIVATYQRNRNPFVDHPEWVGEAECRLAVPSAKR